VPLLVSGTVTGRGGAEPDLAENVNVGFDGNTPVAAALNPIMHEPMSSLFQVELPAVNGPPRTVSIVVQAIFGSGYKTSETVSVTASIWSADGFMTTGRSLHMATVLLDGRVLVHGEIFDPSTGTWTLTEPLFERRTVHTASRLQDGKVLVVGGAGGGALYSA
jgi:hypothetical protein